jgi:COP9 signalosome complex subunit 6
MSDQYTRITTGGSPLPKTAPVVGLLFGLDDEKLEIIDAGEIATDISESTHQQIALHQAVFPQHSVVGWYRVSTEAEPNAEDLATTQKLERYFQSANFCFCFCQANGTADGAESLPMTLYQSHHDDDDDAVVLVALEDNWKLETSDAEKIAVETVIRQQPQSDSSGYNARMASMEQALYKMNERLDVMVQFLQDTEDGTLPFDATLMRSVQSMVCQLGPLVATDPEPVGVESWLPHLAVAAKTVRAVQGYAEKVRELQDHARGYGRGGGGGGGIRRF